LELGIDCLVEEPYMYLLFEVDGVDMVLFVEVAYIVVEIVEEDMEEDFVNEVVLEAYKY
jgi:hypothetical protein